MTMHAGAICPLVFGSCLLQSNQHSSCSPHLGLLPLLLAAPLPCLLGFGFALTAFFCAYAVRAASRFARLLAFSASAAALASSCCLTMFLYLSEVMNEQVLTARRLLVTGYLLCLT
jgi:hypothetical protein